ncbi:2608_t:CDS:2 [Acaulospora colombiana]|uniref:2608_t:CDS:1 n=1 Tax=Acaulospora colombiana TaxID=27376 RepID=A0ACA9K6B5_9GLOM|nr:2608_t:CDS:2 [Acaulospora colombiana]
MRKNELNATTCPNCNEEVLARSQVGPRVTTRHTKVEKKPSSAEKTASPEQITSALPLGVIALKKRLPWQTAKQAQRNSRNGDKTPGPPPHSTNNYGPDGLRHRDETERRKQNQLRGRSQK